MSELTFSELQFFHLRLGGFQCTPGRAGWLDTLWSWIPTDLLSCLLRKQRFKALTNRAPDLAEEAGAGRSRRTGADASVKALSHEARSS